MSSNINLNLFLNLMVTIKLNGQSYYIDRKINLLQLTIYFNFADLLLVLEHNNVIYEKTSWEKIFISDSDKIEIVTIVGGG